jgi:hypothetical protein
VLGLDEGLDGVADVAGGGAGLDGGDAAHHRVIRHLDQPLGPARDVADRIHAARVAVPAVEDQRHVDIDDVALLHRLVVRDAVADDVIDRRAGRLGIAAIHQGRRLRVVIHGELEYQPVDALGRYAGGHLVGEHVEAFGHQPAGLAHAGEGIGAVELDLSGLAQRRARRIDIRHHVRSWEAPSAWMPLK